MGETVLYSTVKFKKRLTRDTAVTQDEDVTYAEVRSTNPTSSDTACYRMSAVTQDEDVTYAEVRSTNPTSSDTVCYRMSAEKSVRSSHPCRLVAVCLGLFCTLLLAATLVLYKSLSQRHSLLERDLEELRASNITMKQERDQLWGNYTILKQEKDQLQGNYTILNKERDQLQRENNNLTQERDKLQGNCAILNKEREWLQRENNILNEERHQLQRENITFQALFRKLPFIQQYCSFSAQKTECKPCPHGWMQFNSKCYYFSTYSKRWTQSRSDCIKWGADLVIIESAEEQDFINRKSRYYRWIGLSDLQTEGTWLWVDGTPVRGGFWRSGEPNDQYQNYGGTQGKNADCAVTMQSEKPWSDTNCYSNNEFVCETDALLL